MSEHLATTDTIIDRPLQSRLRKVAGVEGKLRVLAMSHSSNLAGAQLALSSLVGHTRAEVDWTVITPNDGPLVDVLEEHGNAEVVTMPYPWWCRGKDFTPVHMSADNINAVNGFMDDIDSDLALTNTLTVPWLAYNAHKRGTPHLWYVHEYGDKDHGLVFPYGYRHSIKYIDALSDVVLTISDSVAEHLVANGISPERLMQINQSFDSDIYAKLKPPENNNNLLTIGAIKESKGHADALEAFAHSQLRRTHTLTIAGPVTEPRYADSLVKNIDNYGLNDRVQFKPRRVNTVEEMDKVGTVLVCSRNEALGRVTLEALASGRVVVGSNSGGTASLLDGGRGVLYDGSVVDLTKTLDALPSLESQLRPAEMRKAYVTSRFSPESERTGFFSAVEHAIVNSQKRRSGTLGKTGIIAALRSAAILD